MKADINYHPSLDAKGNVTSHGRRNSVHRLESILKNVDFTGKVVVDLGCQAGFFSSKIAPLARKVIAVDAEEVFIRENNNKYKEVKNLEFVCSKISVDTLSEMPKVDIIICLSVFHHVMVPTHLHDFDSGLGRDDWLKVLTLMRDKCDVLIFELGHPDEKQPWSEGLRKIVGRDDRWISENVFGDSFDEVIDLPGGNYNHRLIKALPWLRRPLLRWPYGRKLMRVLNLAPHDFRPIYIGKRKSDNGGK